MARLPRWIPVALLIAWVAGTVTQAAVLRARPPAPTAASGRVLGIETVVAPGRTSLSWTGPDGRAATLEGDGRFPTWQHPYFAGELRLPGTRLVDRAPGWGEAVEAALRQAPTAHGVAFALAALAILLAGGVPEAMALALWLRLPRALSPAWLFDSDARSYHDAALDLLAGGLPPLQWPPGWPAALAATYALGGVAPADARVLGACLGAAFVGLAARLAPAGRARVAAALLAACSAELVVFSPTLFSEPLFLVLAAGFLVALRQGRPAAAGAWAASAALTRTVSLGVSAVLMVITLSHRGITVRGRLLAVALFVLPVAGWSALASRAAGHPVLVADQAGLNLWIGHGPGATGDWRDPGPAPPEGYGRAAVAAVRADPGAALGRVGRTAARLWSASTSSRTMSTRPSPLPLVPFVALVLLAAVGALRSRDRVALLWLVGVTLTTALFFAPARYKLALYPALVPLAGAAVSRRPGAPGARPAPAGPPASTSGGAAAGRPGGPGSADR